MTTSRDSLRREIEETRSAFHRLLSDVSVEAYGRPSGNPAWNVGQVLFHMSVAPRLMVQDVSMITGERRLLQQIPRVVPRELFDWVNKVYTQRSAQHPTRDFLSERYDRATRNILATLESVREEDFLKGATYPGWDPLLDGEVTLEQLFRYVAAHFNAHEEQIRRAL